MSRRQVWAAIIMATAWGRNSMAGPVAGPIAVFANGLTGAEHIVVDREGVLVGERSGDIVRVAREGTVQPYASIGERVGQLAVMGDGRLFVAAPESGNVWSVPQGGGPATLFLTFPGEPNSQFGNLRSLAATPDGQLYAIRTTLTGPFQSTSFDVVEISSGTPRVVFQQARYFLGTLAVGPRHHLYVTYTAVSEGINALGFPIMSDGTLGANDILGEGVFFSGGMALDQRGDLFFAQEGFIGFLPIDRSHRFFGQPIIPLFPGAASDIAFGQGGRGLSRHDVVLLSSDTTLSKFRFSRPGARLVR